MILGTVVGVVQTNVKRMLAYSSIAHAGYLLIGIDRGQRNGKAAILFYLLAYAVTNLGALGIVALLGTGSISTTSCGFRRPVAIAAGAGRIDDHLPAVARRVSADRRVHRQVVHLQRRGPGRPYWLAIIGVLTSVVSVFFYLRIVVMMYMTEGSDDASPPRGRGRRRRARAGGDRGPLPWRAPDPSLDLALESISTIFRRAAPMA